MLTDAVARQRVSCQQKSVISRSSATRTSTWWLRHAYAAEAIAKRRSETNLDYAGEMALRLQHAAGCRHAEGKRARSDDPDRPQRWLVSLHVRTQNSCRNFAAKSQATAARFDWRPVGASTVTRTTCSGTRAESRRTARGQQRHRRRLWPDQGSNGRSKDRHSCGQRPGQNVRHGGQESDHHSGRGSGRWRSGEGSRSKNDHGVQIVRDVRSDSEREEENRSRK